MPPNSRTKALDSFQQGEDPELCPALSLPVNDTTTYRAFCVADLNVALEFRGGIQADL